VDSEEKIDGDWKLKIRWEMGVLNLLMKKAMA
jgi:hypothetical protein